MWCCAIFNQKLQGAEAITSLEGDVCVLKCHISCSISLGDHHDLIQIFIGGEKQNDDVHSTLTSVDSESIKLIDWFPNDDGDRDFCPFFPRSSSHFPPSALRFNTFGVDQRDGARFHGDSAQLLVLPTVQVPQLKSAPRQLEVQCISQLAIKTLQLGLRLSRVKR